MLILQHQAEIDIDAPPEVVFDLCSDLIHHNELSGAGEIQRVRLLTDGPVALGTRFAADEDLSIGPTRMQMVAQSEVVEFDRPRDFSWISIPGKGPKQKRIQWWFRLTPNGRKTHVVHEVQVDLGAVSYVLMKPIYGSARGERVKRSMDTTLANLKRAAEQRATAPA
jgi:carbon monoxide dehydrogenase subunit G